MEFIFVEPSEQAHIFLTAEMDAFQSKRIARDPVLSRQFAAARELLEGFRDRRLKVSEAFDLQLKWPGLALSPDGRTLVVSACRGSCYGPEEARLYRRPLNELAFQPIPGTDGAASPFFSPDGESVAFFDGLSRQRGRARPHSISLLDGRVGLLGPQRCKLDQLLPGRIHFGVFFRVLSQERVDRIDTAYGHIDSCVGALLIRTNLYQIFRLLIGSHQVSNFVRRFLVVGVDHLRHQSTVTGQDIDRREVSLRTEIPIQDNVAVQDGSDRIRDRIVHVVGFDQHRVESSLPPAPVRPCTRSD